MTGAPAVSSKGRSVVIFGMSRSGTSVITRVVSMIGPALCREDDLYVAADNPTGHWESKTLIGFNDRLFQHLGGSDWLLPPPPLETGWHETTAVRSLKIEARRTFYEVHPSSPWVWKDPRTCVTWPFWRSVLDDDPVALVVVRNPLEVTRSLERRGDGMGSAHALALWERYTHDALVAVANDSSMLFDYADLVTKPREAVTALATVLGDAGVTIRNEQVDHAASFVGGATSQPVTAALKSRELNGAQRELIEYVNQLAGTPTATVIRDEIPPLSAAGTELLDALRPNWHANLGPLSITQGLTTNSRVLAVRKRAAVRTRLRSLVARYPGG